MAKIKQKEIKMVCRECNKEIKAIAKRIYEKIGTYKMNTMMAKHEIKIIEGMLKENKIGAIVMNCPHRVL